MIYEPSDDTDLLLEQVTKYAHGAVLEIGAGSGVLAEAAAQKEEVRAVLAVDIDKDAIRHCQEHAVSKKIQWKVSDLFSAVTEKFDTILFNPPYLPYDRREDEEVRRVTTGGKRGYELTERFLNSVNEHLTRDGIVLLLFSSLTGREKINEILQNNLLDHEEISSRKIPFETLYVYKISKNYFDKILDDKGCRNIRRLAKGHRGLIFTANQKKGRFTRLLTIKIQRWDIAAKGTVNNEITMLKKLNKKGIGPILIDHGENFFIYEFVPGRFILDYLQSASKAETRKVLLDVFSQMYTMDVMHFNKEEMHHPVKHVIVTPRKKATLVDFERCKPTHKPHNVTQFCQFVTSALVQPILATKGIIIDKGEMMRRAAAYKRTLSKADYNAILALVQIFI
ncbi:methyltransferase [Candidatus Woesearchaeota archaeon]|nr:methyltransferase [Candidatus Woesearchaeota archaeon]